MFKNNLSNKHKHDRPDKEESCSVNEYLLSSAAARKQLFSLGFPIWNKAFFLTFPEQTLNMPGKGSKLKGAISFGWPARALGTRRMVEDGARQAEQRILLADVTGVRFSTASPLHLCPCSAASPWPLVPLQHLVCQTRSSFVGILQKMQQ